MLDAIDGIESQQGGYTVFDVQQASDDRTHIIGIAYERGKVWLKSDRLTGWTANYESEDSSLGATESLDAKRVNALLASWLRHNFSCLDLDFIYQGKSNSREGLIAATMIDLIGPNFSDCQLSGEK